MYNWPKMTPPPIKKNENQQPNVLYRSIVAYMSISLTGVCNA